MGRNKRGKNFMTPAAFEAWKRRRKEAKQRRKAMSTSDQDATRNRSAVTSTGANNKQPEEMAKDNAETDGNLADESVSYQDHEKESQVLDPSVQRRVESLVHAARCREALCSFPSCRKIKLLAKHSVKCGLKKGGDCASCKNLGKLRIYHAKYCQNNICPLPFCGQLKMSLQSKQNLKRRQDEEKAPDQTSRADNTLQQMNQDRQQDKTSAAFLPQQTLLASQLKGRPDVGANKEAPNNTTKPSVNQQPSQKLTAPQVKIPSTNLKQKLPPFLSGSAMSSKKPQQELSKNSKQNVGEVASTQPKITYRLTNHQQPGSSVQQDSNSAWQLDQFTHSSGPPLQPGFQHLPHSAQGLPPWQEEQQSYPHQQPFPPHQQPFPPHQQPFPPHQQPFPPHQQPFPPHQQPFPPHQQPFLPHQQQFPSHQSQFPPHQQTFSPHQQQFPPHVPPYPSCMPPFSPHWPDYPQQTFPMPEQVFPPHQQTFPPTFQSQQHQHVFPPGQQAFPPPQSPYPEMPFASRQPTRQLQKIYIEHSLPSEKTNPQPKKAMQPQQSVPPPKILAQPQQSGPPSKPLQHPQQNLKLITPPKGKINQDKQAKKVSPQILQQQALLAPRLKRMQENANSNSATTSVNQQPSQQLSAQQVVPLLEEKQQPKQVPLPKCADTTPRPSPRMLIRSLLQESPEFLSQDPEYFSEHEQALLEILEANPPLMGVVLAYETEEGFEHVTEDATNQANNNEKSSKQFPLSRHQAQKKANKAIRSAAFHAIHCQTLLDSLHRMDMHRALILGLEAGMLIGLQARQFANMSMRLEEVRNGCSVMNENGLRALVNAMQQAVVPHLQDQLVKEQKTLNSVLCSQLHFQQDHVNKFKRKKKDKPLSSKRQQSSPSKKLCKDEASKKPVVANLELGSVVCESTPTPSSFPNHDNLPSPRSKSVSSPRDAPPVTSTTVTQNGATHVPLVSLPHSSDLFRVPSSDVAASKETQSIHLDCDQPPCNSTDGDDNKLGDVTQSSLSPCYTAPTEELISSSNQIMETESFNSLSSIRNPVSETIQSTDDSTNEIQFESSSPQLNVEPVKRAEIKERVLSTSNQKTLQDEHSHELASGKPVFDEASEESVLSPSNQETSQNDHTSQLATELESSPHQPAHDATSDEPVLSPSNRETSQNDHTSQLATELESSPHQPAHDATSDEPVLSPSNQETSQNDHTSQLATELESSPHQPAHDATCDEPVLSPSNQETSQNDQTSQLAMELESTSPQPAHDATSDEPVLSPSNQEILGGEDSDQPTVELELSQPAHDGVSDEPVFSPNNEETLQDEHSCQPTIESEPVMPQLSSCDSSETPTHDLLPCTTEFQGESSLSETDQLMSFPTQQASSPSCEDAVNEDLAPSLSLPQSDLHSDVES